MSSTFRKDLFKDKVVFVAGGTSGINLGIAKGFGHLGATLVVIGRMVAMIALLYLNENQKISL